MHKVYRTHEAHQKSLQITRQFALPEQATRFRAAGQTAQTHGDVQIVVDLQNDLAVGRRSVGIKQNRGGPVGLSRGRGASVGWLIS